MAFLKVSIQIWMQTVLAEVWTQFFDSIFYVAIYQEDLPLTINSLTLPTITH